MLATIGSPEILLILFALVLPGGIPAGIALARKRSPVAWFFLGLLCAWVVSSTLAIVAVGPALRLLLAIGVAPAVLFWLPPGGAPTRADGSGDLS